MARSRTDFHNKLKTITNNVYYQPGDKDSLDYPCIVYNPNYTDNTYANNKVYGKMVSYNVTYMSRTTEIIDDIVENTFMYSRHNNNGKNDGIYHQYFRIYF